jgi:FkbM family methyltransferase
MVRGAAFRVLGESRYERLRARHMAHKIGTGRYRNDEVDLVEHAVAPGDVVVDVGANFGLYSLHLARRVGSRGRVYAFEAAPTTATALRRVLASLDVADRVTVIEKAVGDHAGTVSFDVPRRADGSTDAGRTAITANGGDAIRVPLTRIDDEIASDSVAFMKVDVEGADLGALRGAGALIERSTPTILIEVSPSLLARHGHTPADVGDFFAQHGYATYGYDDGRLTRLVVAAANGDVVAVHPRRAAAVEALLG